MKLKPNNLVETLEICREMGFGPEITAETCWNEGYKLGRKRWYWGPSWFIDLIVRIRAWNRRVTKAVRI